LQTKGRRPFTIRRQRVVCGAETKEIEENPAENRGEELDVRFSSVTSIFILQKLACCEIASLNPMCGIFSSAQDQYGVNVMFSCTNRSLLAPLSPFGQT
jgi:hypothetical protein